MSSNEIHRVSQEERNSITPTSSPDLFSKYSDDSTRLKKLLLKDDDDEFDLEEFAGRHYVTSGAVNVSRSASPSDGQSQGQVNSSRECNPQDDACARKTRLMYEVHPSLLLDDIFAGLHEGSDAEGVDEKLELGDLLSRLLEQVTR